MAGWNTNPGGQAAAVLERQCRAEQEPENGRHAEMRGFQGGQPLHRMPVCDSVCRAAKRPHLFAGRRLRAGGAAFLRPREEQTAVLVKAKDRALQCQRPLFPGVRPRRGPAGMIQRMLAAWRAARARPKISCAVTHRPEKCKRGSPDSCFRAASFGPNGCFKLFVINCEKHIDQMGRAFML